MSGGMRRALAALSMLEPVYIEGQARFDAEITFGATAAADRS